MDIAAQTDPSTYITKLDGEPDLPVLLDADGGVRIVFGIYDVDGQPVALFVHLSLDQMDQLMTLHENYLALIDGQLPTALAA